MNFLHNGLISQLAPKDQVQLLRGSQIISFNTGDVLDSSELQSTQVFFLTGGSVALFVQKKKDTKSGLAVGLVGVEGALGLQNALGLGKGHLTFIAQSAGTAYVVDGAIAMRLVLRKSSVLLVFAQHLWEQFDLMSRMAAMSHTQDVRLRLAHWLLLSAQRCEPAPLVLTHTHIAQMLGVRRVSVTLAAKELKDAGLISYSRGHIFFKNVEGLERVANG